MHDNCEKNIFGHSLKWFTGGLHLRLLLQLNSELLDPWAKIIIHSTVTYIHIIIYITPMSVCLVQFLQHYKIWTNIQGLFSAYCLTSCELRFSEWQLLHMEGITPHVTAPLIGWDPEDHSPSGWPMWPTKSDMASPIWWAASYTAFRLSCEE